MKNNIMLPVSILVGSCIIGAFLYFAQVKKQELEFRQKESELQQKESELQQKINEEEILREKEMEDKKFMNNLKCQDLLTDLKKRWSNIVGIYYSEERNTCIVKYIDNGEVEESPIEDMEDAR